MASSNPHQTRRVVLRIHGEEKRRFHADVVVELPADVTDAQLEKMWPRQFDGIREDVLWDFECTTQIWPSNCGRRIQPAVRRDAADHEETQVRLDQSPNGSLVVRVNAHRQNGSPPNF